MFHIAAFFPAGVEERRGKEQSGKQGTWLTAIFHLLVYIFVGSVTLGPGAYGYIAGSIVGLVGIGYVVLEFLPQIEPPANMREADQGWGAEQV